MSDDTRSRACGFSGHQALGISLNSGSPSAGQKCPPGNTSTGRRRCFRSPTNVCKAVSAQDTSTAPFLTCAFEVHRACLKPLNSCTENCRHQPGESSQASWDGTRSYRNQFYEGPVPKAHEDQAGHCPVGRNKTDNPGLTGPGCMVGILEPPR